jgi:hypothetical protein
MKSLLLLAFVSAALIANPVHAQQKIELFADANRTMCELTDTSPGTVTFHVFMTGPDTATLAGFRARVPDCWTGATWVADYSDYTTIGFSQGEWSVAFGLCLTPPIHVGEITYQTAGSAPPCCEYAIQQPISFPLQYVDCGFAEIDAFAGQSVMINPNESCRCMLPVATEAATWGAVKSLYR